MVARGGLTWILKRSGKTERMGACSKLRIHLAWQKRLLPDSTFRPGRKALTTHQNSPTTACKFLIKNAQHSIWMSCSTKHQPEEQQHARHRRVLKRTQTLLNGAF